MVLDAISRGDLLAQHLDLLGLRAGPVQPGRDQDQDLLPGDSRLVQDREHRPQDGAIGHRPGDVADEYTGALAAPGKLAQRPSADRALERRGDGLLRFIQRRNITDGQRADDALRG